MVNIFKFIALQWLLLIPVSGNECMERDYGAGSTVCVCNSTYCDEISTPQHAPQPGYVTVFTSSKSGLRFHGETKQIGNDLTLSVDGIDSNSWPERHQCSSVNGPKRFKQTVYGFGGSFTDATGININQLSPQTKEKLMKSYFSSTGIQYTLCRVPIGGTDFSTRFYTYHDNETGLFSLTNDDLEDKIPLIHMANGMSDSPIRLFASPWGAPRWMRHEDGIGALKDEAYQLWADYFIKFFEEYEEHNVSFWGVTIQNEPFFARNLRYILPSVLNFMEYDVNQMNTFVNKHFVPTIRSSNFSNLKIMAFDENLLILPVYIDFIMNTRNGTVNNVDGLAFHWYFNEYINYASMLTGTYNNYPGKFLLSTEACTGVFQSPDVHLGNWERGERYAYDIMKVLQNWGSGWVDWNMALDTTGAPNWLNNFVDSPIIVNATEDAFYKQPMFYAIGHFSKFIPPGSKIVDLECQCSDKDVELVVASVSRNDQNQIVAVVLNRSEKHKLINLTDDTKVIQMDIPPKAIQTYLWTTDS